MPHSIDEILRKLGQKPPDGGLAPSALDLLSQYDQKEYEAAWEGDPAGPRLYRAFAKELIDQGYPTTGLKIARRRLDKEYEGVVAAHHKSGAEGEPPPREAVGDPVLRYRAAAAFARGGNPGSAEPFVKYLLLALPTVNWAAAGVDRARFEVDVISLRGRLFKDLYRRSPAAANRAQLAKLSAAEYERAARLRPGDPFPWVNAATMRYLEGRQAADPTDAAAVMTLNLAAAHAEKARGLIPTPVPADADYWTLATAGEACLLLGRDDESKDCYGRAVAAMVAARHLGSVASLIGNLKLLIDAGVAADDPAWIETQVGAVVAFSGHLIDQPWRASPRFPHDEELIRRAAAAIRAHLAAVNARFGYSSLGSGADILFAEAMLDRDADLQVFLPFARDDFLAQSVHYGVAAEPWAGWGRRFDAVLKRLRPEQVQYATTEPYLGSYELFAHANDVLQGMAIVRAGQLGVRPQGLAVLDPDAAAVTGGTADFVARWQEAGYAVRRIDLRALRPDPLAVPPARPAPAGDPRPELPRPVRAMLFADVAGFSKMEEKKTPQFFRLFTATLAKELTAGGDGVLMANTWGDGVFMVFAGVTAAADFAVRLIDRFNKSAVWKAELGFKDPNPLRLGLHAGPVFEMARDPILNRSNFFGQHVNRTARIEPVTLPGCAYASEQFAALLTVAAPQAFTCEFVGVEALAKGYATAPLYRVGRLNGAPRHCCGGAASRIVAPYSSLRTSTANRTGGDFSGVLTLA